MKVLLFLFIAVLQVALGEVGPHMMYGDSMRSPTCVLSLQVNTKENPGGIMGGVHLAYKTGFNAVYVPIQKTRDAFPRMVVSTDPTVSGKTMMQISQSANSQGNSVHLLGEFLGSTSNLIEVMLMSASVPSDVDMIVHEMSQTSRDTSSFVLVIPPRLAETQKDGSDALSRFRSLVPDGRAMIYFDEYTRSLEAIPQVLGLAKTVGVDVVAVPAAEVEENLLGLARAENVHVGAFNADTEREIKTVMNSTVSFFTTRNPWAYLTITAPKSKIPVVKSHAAVILG